MPCLQFVFTIDSNTPESDTTTRISIKPDTRIGTEYICNLKKTLMFIF